MERVVEESLFRSHLLIKIKLDEIEHEYSSTEKEMRVLESVVITVLLTIIVCNHIPKQTERKIIPIVDKNNEIHIYKSSNPLRLDNDYGLYCMEHHTWETIQVRYKPNQLSKLRSEEYTVRKHPKSS